MSDVSKTNDLIAELRKAQDAAGFIPHGTMDHETQWLPFANLYNAAEALLEDLEAATRVPVQGEPNDDREALRDEFRSYLGDEIYVSSRDYSAWAHGTMGMDDFSLAADDDEIIESLVSIALSRAAVSDAATELRAERDAALAAIERVRDFARGLAKGGDEAGAELLLAALDGAPEPEWEYRYAEIHDDSEMYTYGPRDNADGCFDTAEDARDERIEDTDVVVRRPKRPASEWEVCE